MQEKLALIAAGFCFLAGFARTMWAVGAHRYHRSAANLLLNAGGFIFLTLFLHLRGQALGKCPLTNLGEVLIFLSWATVLTYLVVGSTYRLSLIGAFTAPLVATLLGLALVFDSGPPTGPPAPRGTLNPWLETHAAVSLIAYGVFALACIAGAMYLFQDRLLKRREFNEWFHNLPPIHTLAQANGRLLIFGFILLSIGLSAGFFVNRETPTLKLMLSIGVWVIYAVIILLRSLHALPERRVALYSVSAFLLSFGSLVWMEFLRT